LLLGLFGWVTVASVLWLLAPAILQAQYPRARRGQFEVRGMDFRPEGAWRQRVASVRATRHRLLRSQAFAALNSTAVRGDKVTGDVFVPVVPIAFRNVPPPFPRLHYEELFFSTAPAGRPYSLKTFYEQLSNGNISVAGRVLDPVARAPSAGRSDARGGDRPLDLARRVGQGHVERLRVAGEVFARSPEVHHFGAGDGYPDRR
jgi:hypothetical protein